MTREDLEAWLLILLLVTMALGLGVQILASLRWSSRASAIVCVSGTLLVALTSLALIAANANRTGFDPDAWSAMALAASIPAGCWAAIAVVAHFLLTFLRRRSAGSDPAS